MRTRILLTLFLAALCARSTFAELTLAVPADGVTLAGDRFATIAWSADAPLEAEEWEAFLSVDGGRYYSARITPHLDINIRTFQFCVPNVASDDVRILIRVGDERRETIIELPQRFSIRPSPQLDLGRRFRSAAEAPEGARPGDPLVVEWASGGRNGANVVVQSTSARAVELRCAVAPLTPAWPTLSLHRGEGVYLARVALLAQRLVARPRARLVSRDVLRLTARLNI